MISQKKSLKRAWSIIPSITCPLFLKAKFVFKFRKVMLALKVDITLSGQIPLVLLYTNEGIKTESHFSVFPVCLSQLTTSRTKLQFGINTYGSLTKHEVKMAGYWPSSFFARLWTDTQSWSINSQKKDEANIKPS